MKLADLRSPPPPNASSPSAERATKVSVARSPTAYRSKPPSHASSAPLPSTCCRSPPSGSSIFARKQRSATVPLATSPGCALRSRLAGSAGKVSLCTPSRSASWTPGRWNSRRRGWRRTRAAPCSAPSAPSCDGARTAATLPRCRASRPSPSRSVCRRSSLSSSKTLRSSASLSPGVVSTWRWWTSPSGPGKRGRCGPLRWRL